LGEGILPKAYELDRKIEKRVPKAIIGCRLSQDEAKKNSREATDNEAANRDGLV
jgi:hypothetical protein